MTHRILSLFDSKPVHSILGAAGLTGGSVGISLIETLSVWMRFGAVVFGFLTAMGGFALMVRSLWKAYREDSK